MSQTWHKKEKEKQMRVRFIGLLTEAQVSKGLAGYKAIKPADGIFIKSGLSYTFTFKNGIASAVTIRRAPQITLLDNTEDEVPAPKPEVVSSTPVGLSFDQNYASVGDGYNRVVSVKTEAEAIELLTLATAAGYKWNSHNTLLSHLHYNEYEAQTAYWFDAKNKRVEYSPSDWYKEQGAEVVVFSPETVATGDPDFDSLPLLNLSTHTNNVIVIMLQEKWQTLAPKLVEAGYKWASGDNISADVKNGIVVEKDKYYVVLLNKTERRAYITADTAKTVKEIDNYLPKTMLKVKFEG